MYELTFYDKEVNGWEIATCQEVIERNAEWIVNVWRQCDLTPRLTVAQGKQILPSIIHFQYITFFMRLWCSLVLWRGFLIQELMLIDHIASFHNFLCFSEDTPFLMSASAMCTLFSSIIPFLFLFYSYYYCFHFFSNSLIIISRIGIFAVSLILGCGPYLVVGIYFSWKSP